MIVIKDAFNPTLSIDQAPFSLRLIYLHFTRPSKKRRGDKMATHKREREKGGRKMEGRDDARND